ncbi:hypothetical protein GCM10020229_74040 [Kitasatospora albolonga]
MHGGAKWRGPGFVPTPLPAIPGPPSRHGDRAPSGRGATWEAAGGSQVPSRLRDTAASAQAGCVRAAEGSRRIVVPFGHGPTRADWPQLWEGGIGTRRTAPRRASGAAMRLTLPTP